jgi:uroporphyrinogen decarboxylase
MRQAGRYLPEYRQVRSKVASFLDLCRTPELAAEVTLQPLRRFDFDAAIVFSDILIVPYALGQKVEFIEGEGPKLEPIRDGKAVARLDRAGIAGALAPVYETVGRVVAELPKEVPLMARVPYRLSTAGPAACRRTSSNAGASPRPGASSSWSRPRRPASP